MRNFDRDNRSGNRRSGSRPEMHKAICDECGASCEVPFKPTGNKPIFCSTCFEKQGGSDSRYDRNDNSRRGGRDFSSASASLRRDGRSNSRERQMFPAICDECGAKCEIPFKPSNDKPIYCSTCFSKKDGQNRFDKGNSRSGGKTNQFENEFKAINAKLDEILQILSPSKPKKVAEVVEKKAVKRKAVAKKKAVTKKKVVAKKKVTKKPAKKKVAQKKK